MPNGRARSDPRFYLTAAPLGRVEVPTLFEQEGVGEVLEEPPTLRPPTLGWDLWTLDTPSHVPGKKAFVANGYRKRLTLFTGGTLTFVGSCIEFLGWPRHPVEFLRDPGLNGVGLTELVFNFGLTVATIREFMEPSPDWFSFRSGFRDLELRTGARVYLEDEAHAAPRGSHDFPPCPVEWGDDFAEAAAYNLVLQVYEWFGVGASAAPFVDHERHVLDAAALDTHLKGSSLPALAAP
jgi:hypothetical protein